MPAEGPSPLERRLVSCAQHGDRNAFARLVRVHGPPVAKLASRMVGSGPDAEDVVQDTLEHAWRTLPSFRGDAKFSTWLYRIAMNEALRCISRRRRERLVDPGDAMFEAASESDTIIDVLAGREMARCFVRCVSQLPGHYRDAVLLCDVGGMSNGDGARVLGLRVANFKTRLHRGRVSVARKMDELFAAPGLGEPSS